MREKAAWAWDIISRYTLYPCPYIHICMYYVGRYILFVWAMGWE